MKKQGLAALLAAVCMLTLGGCGDKGEIQEGMYYDATGIGPDAILITVNEREIPAERYFYWLDYNSTYTVERLGEDLDWTQVRSIPAAETATATALAETDEEAGSAEDGDAKSEEKDKEKPEAVEQSLDAYVKQMALENTALYVIIEEWAQTYAVELTAEDKMAMAQEYQDRCIANGGETAYLQSLAEQGISPALAESFSRDYHLYQRLYALFLEEGSPLAPAEGALEEYVKAQQLCSVDYIFISTEGTKHDPAALELRRERANMVLNRLNEKTNPPADFYMMMEAYSDRKDFVSGGFTFAPGESGFGEAFEREAAQLDEWEYSAVPLEGPDGFYILRGRGVNTAAVSQDYFDQLLSDAVAAANISTTRVYKKLTAESFYTEMTRLRNGEPAAEETE